jgi:uncharacterized membrane protein YGL010W
MNHRAIKLMKDYKAYHSKKGTVLSHLVGVPVVFFSMLILFSFVQVCIPELLYTNLAWIAVILLGIFYLTLDIAVGFITFLWITLLCWLATCYMSMTLFIITFILGWIFQLAGHKIEGKKPALFDNFFASVFIAPFFIVNAK